MKFKLVDVDSEDFDDVEFGTCSLCFHVGSYTANYYTFENELGQQDTLEGGEWNYGDYYDYEIGNVIDFADWLKSQEFDFGRVDNDGFLKILNRYVQDKYKEE